MTPHAEHGAHRDHGDRVEHAPHAGHAGGANHTGHAAHAGHTVAMFRDRFWLSLALTLPTLIWGHMLPDAFRYMPPRFPGSAWIPALFGTVVFVYGGLVFLQGAVRELRDRRPGMMTLIALAITVAFVFSAAVALGAPGMPLWEELSTLVTVMLLGHWIEMRSVTRAQGALNELARLLPDTATRVVGSVAGSATEEVPVAALREGDVVLVRPGANVPADGVVRQGTSAVNESMITGESRPVDKHEGAVVTAGTVNGAGALRVEVTGTGERTMLAGIMRLVSDAQRSKSRTQVLADRAAFWLTLAALGSGVVTLLVWLALHATPAFAVERVVTVLVIACPHALGLAIPLVVAVSTSLGAQRGLLVRDRRGFEEARLVDTVVFDKTGTLTKGEFGVVDVVPVDGISAEELLRIAAAVEHDSEHTIARGIVRSATERGVEIPPSEAFVALPGTGATARVGGHLLSVGGPALLRDRKLAVPQVLAAAADRAAAQGASAIYVADEQRLLGVLAVADVVRDESREAVRALRAAGVEVVMMTGDATAVANAVGKAIGIETVYAEVRPDQKAERVRALEEAGRRVAMVGDGINDAPALATAAVGIAMGAGTDVAVEAGDIVLVRSDPRDIPRLIALSRASYRKMVQNLWWAAGYNVVAIPLAAGVLAPLGFVLSPAMGAVLMSLSTVIVAVNARLLR